MERWVTDSADYETAAAAVGHEIAGTGADFAASERAGVAEEMQLCILELVVGDVRGGWVLV